MNVQGSRAEEEDFYPSFVNDLLGDTNMVRHGTVVQHYGTALEPTPVQVNFKFVL